MTLCDVPVPRPSHPRVSHITVRGCFSRNGDFDLVHGLGVLRNYFKEWASIDVPFNAVEGSLLFYTNFDILGQVFQLAYVTHTKIIFVYIAYCHQLYNSSPISVYLL